MDWMTRAAWLYQGSNPDYPKLAAHRIRTIYVDPRANNAHPVLIEAHQRKLQAGIYLDPHWYANDTAPGEFARIVSGEITRLIPGRGNPVMVDIELLPLEWTRDFLAAYRVLRPQRETAYTNSPFQDGTVVPIPALRDAGVHWYPQLYYGDMSPADGATVLLQLIRSGFPAERLHPFYDGARLPDRWGDGCVFTMERIP